MHRLWEHDAKAPVWRQGGQVVVASHALVRRVLGDQAVFAPGNALDAVTPIPVAALRVLSRNGFRLPATLANNGTDTHPALRAIVGEAMTPARVDALRPWLTGVVRRRVARLAARLREGGTVDLYESLAADLPLLALARLIVMPEQDVAVVKRFSRAALELFWAPLDAERQERLAHVVGEHHAALRELARTVPSGLIAELRAHCGPGGEDQVVAALFFLLVAGQETTSQFLTLLLHRLAGEPAVRDGLASGRHGVAEVVEEGLRLVPPIVSWRRVAAVDTELDGFAVHAGESVLLWLGAAGREAAGDDYVPGQRGSRRHLAFGAGAHRCLGAQLARMEAAVVVAEAAPLLRGCEVVKAPDCPDNLSFRMPDALVITRSRTALR
ncbi:cytochrome P450 [Phytomonospora endophytica]|uniref:cytochrome P450 n=1 Tax=Phytomonospora endophytica TaxID=714109 RepID=UPI001C85B72D|nr:cytochrome P450 [Phytomonospora endophytica]